MEIAHILRLIEREGVEAIEDDMVEVKGSTKVDNDFQRTLRRAAVCLANTSGGQMILGVDETTNSIEGCPDIDPVAPCPTTTSSALAFPAGSTTPTVMRSLPLASLTTESNAPFTTSHGTPSTRSFCTFVSVIPRTWT